MERGGKRRTNILINYIFSLKEGRELILVKYMFGSKE